MRRLLWTFAGALALYGLAAYVVLPALWYDYEHQPGLAGHPMVTATAQGIPGDPLNVGIVGAEPQLVYAMTLAGWKPADALTVRSSVAIGLSVVLDRPYADAPVSSLFLGGRRQDLAFERLVGGSADRRHHVRFWRVLKTGVEGREVWLGAASFDRSVGLSHDTLQITHHIDPDLDRERDFLVASLEASGIVTSTYQVAGAGPTLDGRNGGGDAYYTDGALTLAVIDPDVDPAVPQTHVPAVPVSQILRAHDARHRAWAMVLWGARALRLVPGPDDDHP